MERLSPSMSISTSSTGSGGSPGSRFLVKSSDPVKHQVYVFKALVMQIMSDEHLHNQGKKEQLARLYRKLGKEQRVLRSMLESL